MLNLDETGQGQNPRSDMSQKENSGTWLKFGQRRESLSSPPRRLVPRSKCSATASCSRHAPPGLCAHCCCCWNAFPSTYQGPSGPHPPPLVSQAVPTGPVTGTFRTPPFPDGPRSTWPHRTCCVFYTAFAACLHPETRAAPRGRELRLICSLLDPQHLEPQPLARRTGSL